MEGAVRAILVIGSILLSVSCSPSTKCGGALYFDPDNVSCRPCPTNARLEGGTCVCPSGLEFRNHQCVGASDAAAEQDEDAGAPRASAACIGYCDFIRVCLADNALAAAAVPAVITGLHADAADECARECAAAGGDGALAACAEAGREAAACAGDDTQVGLQSALMLIADCAHAHMDDPLLPPICEALRQSTLVSSRIDFCD
jgi:hypothetical protein